MVEIESIKEEEEEKSELELKLVEYGRFLGQLFEKRKQLGKWIKGLKGLRETALRQDKVLQSNVNALVTQYAKACMDKKFKDTTEFKEYIQNLKPVLRKEIQTRLGERRKIDKYFDNSVETLLSGILDMDKSIVEKILELLNNIEVTHIAELEKLKVQIADLVTQNEELRRENEALRKGIPKKRLEIPEIAEIAEKSISCPICLQTHKVAYGTKIYKCDICGHEIKVPTEVTETAR